MKNAEVFLIEANSNYLKSFEEEGLDFFNKNILEYVEEECDLIIQKGVLHY